MSQVEYPRLEREAQPHTRVIFKDEKCYPTHPWVGIRAQDLSLAAASLGCLPWRMVILIDFSKIR